MDANPAPGAIPAVGGIEKVLPKSTDPVDASEAPATAPEVAPKTAPETTAPVDAATAPATEPDVKQADAPKPASVEDAPDKDGPIVDKPAAVNGAAPVEESAADGAAAADGDDKIVTEKPAAVNGSDKDVQMTGAIDEAPAPAPATDAKDMAVKPPAAPVAAGEREAAPQAIPAEEKPQEKTESDKKRKADVLDETPAVPQGGPVGGAEEPPKRKPGRPPSNKSNGDANGDENLGHKLAKKAKKVLPVGKTERKTRSQGPA